MVRRNHDYAAITLAQSLVVPRRFDLFLFVLSGTLELGPRSAATHVRQVKCKTYYGLRLLVPRRFDLTLFLLGGTLARVWT